MKIKKYNPTSSGLRHRLINQKNLLALDSLLIKNLSKFLKRSYGRSSQTGRITSWHRSRGAKRKFKKVHSLSSPYSISLGVFYDPNRSCFISLNFDFQKKTFDFSLTPYFSFSGTCTLNNNFLDELSLGSRTKLSSLPPGTVFYNLGSKQEQIGNFSRSAGTYCQMVQKTATIAKIKLPSNKIVAFPVDFYASLGTVSNLDHKTGILGKAGASRWKGRRPIVRGIAMNPIDHPHGGRTNGGRPCVTPWGKPTKGKPTVR